MKGAGECHSTPKSVQRQWEWYCKQINVKGDENCLWPQKVEGEVEFYYTQEKMKNERGYYNSQDTVKRGCYVTQKKVKKCYYTQKVKGESYLIN